VWGSWSYVREGGKGGGVVEWSGCGVAAATEYIA